MNADGTGQTNITNDTTDDDTPSWSQMEPKILFTSSRDSLGSGQSEIYTMTPTGESVTPVLVGYNRSGRRPAKVSLRAGVADLDLVGSGHERNAAAPRQ